jgi:hypothetical protein
VSSCFPISSVWSPTEARDELYHVNTSGLSPAAMNVESATLNAYLSQVQRHPPPADTGKIKEFNHKKPEKPTAKALNRF